MEVSAELQEPCFAFSLSLQEEVESGSESSASESPVVPCRSLLKPQLPKPYPSLMQSRPNYETKLGKGFGTQSAPMLPVLQSTHNTSFYTKSRSCQPGDSMTSSSWTSKSRLPLGAAWREQDRGLDGEPLRTNSDDGREYIHGCIPNWGTDRSIRSMAAVEQKLSWAYYHMRGMRPEQSKQSSKLGGQQFNFWTDLRPPFRVKAMSPEPDEGHPDGPLFRITYCCPLDYVTERKWGRTENGSFENTVQGVAEVRIPKDFPQISKHVVVLSWGRPQIKFGAKQEKKEVQPVIVDPKKWSPIAAEFHLRSTCSRLAKLRESLHETNVKIASTQTRPWQRVLMKPKATLGDFIKAEKEMEEAVDSPKRDMRIHTACAGFVDIEG